MPLKWNFSLVGAIAIIFYFAGMAGEPILLGQEAREGSSGLRTFFAFERELWMETPGAVLKLQPLRRYPGNPVIPRGKEGAHDSHRVSYTSVLPEGNKLRAWYQAMPAGGKRPDDATAYAQSEDGIQWVNPSLDLVEPGPT